MPGSHDVTVQHLASEQSELALFSLQGTIRERTLESLQSAYLKNGRFTDDARALSPHTAKSLLVAGGAAAGTGISAATAGTLFMATADPSTLMKVGSGVGSAVMGPSGITAQAAFLPVASSLPVVAPLMAVQALSSAVIMRQFQLVERKIDAVKTTLDRLLARYEAEKTAQLITASDIIEEIQRQYDASGEFSQDMLIRLALAERDLRTVAQRARVLAEAYEIHSIQDAETAERANHDIQAAILTTFVELRAAYLRVGVDVQENPNSVADSKERLTSTLRESLELWDKLLSRASQLEERIQPQESTLSDRNLLQKLASSEKKELDALREAHRETQRAERAIIDGLGPLKHDISSTLEELEASTTGGPGTLVYWQDADGEHAFTTGTDLIRLTA